MNHLSKLLIVPAIALAVASAAHADDQTVTTTTTTTTSPNGEMVKRVITTVAPAPKELVTVPLGFVSCFTVKGGWYNDIWAAEHDVCTYSNSPEGVVWVQGYWQCNKYDEAQGQCHNWDWKAAHWEKTVNIY